MNFIKASNLKKSVLFLCCSVYLSSPLYAAVSIKNETGESVTCIMKKGKEGKSSTEIIKKDGIWKAKCNFLTYNICPVLCFTSDRPNGKYKLLHIVDENKKFKIQKKSKNELTIKPM